MDREPDKKPAPAEPPPRTRRLRHVLTAVGLTVALLAAFVLLLPSLLTSIHYPELTFDLSEQLKDTPEGLFPDPHVRVRLSLRRGTNCDYKIRANGKLLGWPFSANASVDLDFRFFGVAAHGKAKFALDDSALALTATFAADSSGEWQAQVELPPTPLTEQDVILRDLLSRLQLTGVTDLAFSGELSLTASAEQTRAVPVPKWTARGRLQDFGATLTASGQDVTVSNLRVPFGASGLADHTDISPVFLHADQIQAAGFTLTNAFASIRPTERALLVTEAGAGFCGGDIRLYSLFLDMTRLNAGLTLFVDGVDTGETLQHLKGFQGEASGRLHGKIPLQLVNGKELKLRHAYLYSVPGEVGNLRLYDATPITNNLALVGVDDKSLDNLSRALADLDYSVLKFALVPEADGQLALEVKIEGTATHGNTTVPVSLDVTFHGDIEQLVNTGLKATTRSNPR